ncbi:MAG: A24 family peptidase [Pyrinomonadaceae bacterium]
MTYLFSSTFEDVLGLPDYIGYVFVFIFGACTGSFLNVVIYRVPNELSVVRPSSACPDCKKPISFYDNIPILSWLVLGAKCRNCKGSIAWRYPAVELLTASIFVLTALQLGFNAFLPVALFFVAAVISLIFIDAEHMILPNVITYPLLVFALAVRLIFPLVTGSTYFADTVYWPLSLMYGSPSWVISLTGAILGGLTGGGFLWLVGELWKRLRGVDAMGLGDVKMMFGVGALLGWRLTILTIFLSAFAGALIGMILILKQKDKNLQMQMPFGIFLGIGSIVALLFGDRILAWYISNFVG